jgi:hypothetical protein
MFLTRRQFLNGLTAAALAGPWLLPPPLLASSFSDKPGYLVTNAGTKACLIDLMSNNVIAVQLDFKAHSFVQHPRRPARFLAIEKWGPNCAEVDFFERRVTRTVKCPDGFWFYGHGVSYEEGNAFFITRVDMKTGLGHLVAYDRETYVPGIDYQVAPGGLHECHMLPDQTLLVTSYGVRSYGDSDKSPEYGKRVAKTALLHVDMRNGKLLDPLIVEDENQILGHFGLGPEGTIVALSAQKPESPAQHGRVYYSAGIHDPLRPMEWPQEENAGLKGELLSAAFTPDGNAVAVTSPADGAVLLFDAKKGSFVAVQKIQTSGIVQTPGVIPTPDIVQASGIVYEQALQAFLANDGTRLFRIDADFSRVKPIHTSLADTIPLDSVHSVLVDRAALN